MPRQTLYSGSMTGEPREYEPDEVEFMMAVHRRQSILGRYLDWREVLEVARSLGYKRVEPCPPTCPTT